MSPTHRSTARAFALGALLPGIAAVPSNGAPPDCSLTTIGVPALADLGQGLYAPGHVGGLYPGGSNRRPDAHEALGLSIARDHVMPRDAAGGIDLAGGRIVMISVGMSNTTQEFDGGAQTFVPRMNADPTKNGRLVLVDGAQGGQPASAWVDPSAPVWSTVDQRLANAGVTPEQVQVAWIKQAEAGPLGLGVFPAHAEVLQADLEAIARNLRANYPNLRLAYFSSRTRAWTDVAASLNPEPFAFESAFSVRWMIEKQLLGDPSLDPDPLTGNAPWISWGPYLWADGEAARSDGFTWLCSDVNADFTHPSPTGRGKVADQLVAFFKTDATTTPWVLRDDAPGQAPSLAAGADVLAGDAPLVVTFDAAAGDADGIVTEYAWTFDDGGFSFAEDPVKVFPTPGVYDVALTVSDDDGNTAQATVTVTVSAGPPVPPTITTASPLPDGELGEPTAQTFTATGTAPIDWQVMSGSPPPGMALSGAGLYSGTPLAAGTFVFTVEAVNSAGSDSAALEHTIVDAGPALPPLADAYVRDGAQADANFGTAPNLAVRGSAGTGNARSYLSFELSELGAGCGSATLELVLTNGAAGLPVQIFSVADDTWVETAVTWNDRPLEGALLDEVVLAGSGSYAFDVSSFFASELAGDGVMSLVLIDGSNAGILASFASRESGTPPELVAACGGDPTVAYCFCDAGAPCGNTDPGAGCASSLGTGARLAGSGSTSVGADDLLLAVAGLPQDQFGLVYMGPEELSFPFGDGHRCVGGGATGVFRFPVRDSGPSGAFTEGPIVGFTQASFPPPGQVASGSTWRFQGWYRDPGGPCGSGFNLSNAVSATFAP